MTQNRFLPFPLVFLAGVVAASAALIAGLGPVTRWAFFAAVEIPAVGVGLWYVLGARTGVSFRLVLREAALASWDRYAPLILLPLAAAVFVSIVAWRGSLASVPLAAVTTFAAAVLALLVRIWRWTRQYKLGLFEVDGTALEALQAEQERFQCMEAQAEERVSRAIGRYRALATDPGHRERFRLLRRAREARIARRAKRDARAARHLVNEAATERACVESEVA
jgi:hypothetical protein